MLAPNIARFLDGEDREVRGNIVAHPSTPSALRRAASKPNERELRSVTNSTRSGTGSGPAGAEGKQADVQKLQGTSASVRAEAKPFRRGFLTAAAVLIAVPSALLVAIVPEGLRHWQHKESTLLPAYAGLPSGTEQALSNAPIPSSKAPEIVLTSPHKLEAKAGEEIDFAIAIDSTEALPARSLVAISAMPEGASFSEGRPYGMTGWSLRPDEVGDLRLLLPKAETGSYDMRVEFLAGDGIPLAQSETRLKINYDVEILGASADASESIASPESFAPPPPQEDVASESTDSSLKVTSVKTTTIKPATLPRTPQESGLALAKSAETPAEWVQIVKAVNMHPRPERSSKTIKVANKGAKLRVLARNKSWVQVSDPTTSVKGWVYRRFVKPAEPPA
jgi:hypothetical protein